MGEKYLKTKDNSLEASVLDVWKDAAKLDEYKTKIGEKRRVAGGDMRRTENKVEVKEATGDKEEYTKFFNAALKKFGVKSPAELKGKKEENHTLYVSHSTWSSEKDFLNWTQSSAFRQAHKGAGEYSNVYLGHPEFEGFEVVI